jgi:3-hydroxy-9,10-secoandrosta-1,3,5(10)-triene-9,17-dione monooxygenase reductase component
MTEIADRVDPSAFRRVLGVFATGVVVVAAVDGDRPVGMSANSFASVSLEPPLVLFCPARTSTTWPRLRAVGAFVVSVLAAEQEAVGRGFARRDVDRFAGVGWRPGPSGHPVLDDALVWLDCTLDAVHQAGDHEIAVARVTALSPEPATGVEPLVFFRGRYTGLPAGD